MNIAEFWHGTLALLGWSLIIAALWQLITVTRSAIAISKQMHRIPCTRCRFFNNDYRLKCALHPRIANTDIATRCLDFTAES